MGGRQFPGNVCLLPTTLLAVDSAPSRPLLAGDLPPTPQTPSRFPFRHVTDHTNGDSRFPVGSPLVYESVAPGVADVLANLGIQYDVIECDPELADTARFCAHYGFPLDHSANTILVASRRPPGRYAACLVLASTKLDVNHRVRDLLGVKKISFASPEATTEVTRMAIGGVTPFALPAGLPVLVDERIMALDYVVLGAGSRSAKLRVPPSALASIPGVVIVHDLAEPVSETQP